MRIANVVLNDFTRDNRVLKITQSLVAEGYEVKVLALQGVNQPFKEIRDGYVVHRIPVLGKRLPRGMLFGFFKFSEIALRIIWKWRRLDAWHCNDIEAFGIGVLAQILNPRLKLLYDCHEFESERNGKSDLERRLVGWMERRFIHRASTVFLVSPSIERAYHERYDSHGLPVTRLLRNVPHSSREKPADHVGLRQKLGLEPHDFVAIYQGALTLNRGVEQLLQAARTMEQANIHLVFMGYGIFANEVQETASQLPWVHFLDAVPYEEVLSHTSEADVGLLSVKPTCLSYRYCLPNKLFEYLLAGLPVLTNDLPDCRTLLDEYHAGLTVMPDTARGWKEALEAVKEQQGHNSKLLAEGLARAQRELHWDLEAESLREAYRSL